MRIRWSERPPAKHSEDSGKHELPGMATANTPDDRTTAYESGMPYCFPVRAARPFEAAARHI